MPNRSKTFAFLDGQNLHLGLKESGIALDYKKFRIYLREKLGVTEAYYFIGYVQENQALYASLQQSGFILQFKEVSKGGGKTKGNVDVDLTIGVMDKISEYDLAVLVTNDGDFANLVNYLIEKKKFATVLVPLMNPLIFIRSRTRWPTDCFD